MMQHLIKKQIIELYIDKRLDAFNTQHLVSQHFWNYIVPELEKAFDDVSDDLSMVHLDKLEIDLGIITAKMIQDYNWTPDIIGKVSHQIKKKLTQPAERSKKVKEEISLSICRQWMSYIQNGFLPWETLSINDQWFDLVLRALAKDYFAVTELKELIISNPNAARRIVLQHDEKFLTALSSIMTSETDGRLSNIINELLKKEEMLTSKIRQLFPLVKNLNPTQKQTRKEALKDTAQLTNNEIQSAKNSLIKEQKTFLKSRTLEEDGVFISNAGIVLLHPFLSHFFKRQRLVDAGKFKSPDSVKKAIFLLHFLATGETEAEEHRLVVPKILCDFPVEEAIEKTIDLSETEITEAVDLLTAAIQQWDILKETSIEGLRTSFLQRNGKLLTKKEQLFLQIETSSIDLLLDHLPWNLSIIKLPWMTEILRVEWR